MQILDPKKDFNDVLVESLNVTISVLLSQQVMEALFLHLEKFHSITRDEIPYRIETLLSTLEEVFGVSSTKTISKAVAKQLYTRLGLTFTDKSDMTLAEYVEAVKKELRGCEQT